MNRKYIILIAILAISYQNLQCQIFENKSSLIKSNECEFKITKFKKEFNSNSIFISNIKNTLWMTDQAPKVRDILPTYSKDDFIKIYMILKETINKKTFDRLLKTEKIPMSSGEDISIVVEKTKNTDRIDVYIFFKPYSGEIFEIYYIINGEILKSALPNVICNIESRIRNSGIIDKYTKKNKSQFYTGYRYSYYFHDIDAITIGGEKIILSNIK